MCVDPVDDRVVDLVLDGFVDGLVHQTLPLDDLLVLGANGVCLLYTSPSPRDRQKSRMPSSA